MIRLFLLVAAAMLPIGAAVAQTPVVSAARQNGLVGERYDGYLGYVGAASPRLRGQVDSINIRRRALYSNLAASRGVSPQEVGITAGCQLLRRVEVGEAFLLSGAAWRRRLSGQAPLVPDYCR